jgi:hypothetical protein
MNSDGATGFDDDGQAVPAVDFDFADVQGWDDEIDTGPLRQIRRAVQKETIVRLIQHLTSGNPSAEHLGRRVHYLAFRLGQSPCKTQADLAQKLGISEAAVSKQVKAAKRETLTAS